MGDKGTKKTNKMLETQTNKANTFADKLGGFGNEERQYQTGLRSNITDRYNQLYDTIGADGGSSGGGGGGYTPPAFAAPGALSTVKLNYNDPRTNEAYGGFKNFAETGGFSPDQAADFRARGSATLPAYYEGLKTQLGAANRAAGGNVGFNTQMSKLAREQAYGGQRAALDTEVGLQDQIRQGKQFGLTGQSNLDESKIGREGSIEDKRNAEVLRQNQDTRDEQLRQEAAQQQYQSQQQAAAQAAASASRRGDDEAFARKMAVLGELRGLRGEQGTDLPYYDREIGGINSATGAVANRVPETSTLDTIGNAALGLGGSLLASQNPLGFLNKPKPKPTTGGQRPGLTYG